MANGVLVASVMLAFVLVLYGANGLRGSDQYWYVADVETLAADRAPLSNTWFPMGLLRAEADGNGYTAPFYHNGPLMHLVAALEQRLPASAYATWIGVNLLCLLVTVGTVWWWLRRRTCAAVAGWVAAFAALAPIAVWQSANTMRETWFGALSALALTLFFLVPPNAPAESGTGRSWQSPRAAVTEPALALVLATGALSHPMFLILLALLVLVRAAQWLGDRHTARALAIVPALLALVIVQLFKERWFPSSFQPSLSTIITSAVPGVTNMAWHLSDTPVALDIPFLLSKLRAAAERQFAEPGLWPIYLQTHAALVAWLALVLRAWRQPSTGSSHPTPFALLVLGAFLGLYAAIIVLQQNQIRFQQLIAPAAFILIGHALHVWLPRRRLPLVMVPVLLGSMAVATLMVRQLHDESAVEQRDRAALATTFEIIDADDRVLLVDVRRDDAVSFVLRPTIGLFIRQELISAEAATEAARRFDPTALVTGTDELPYGLTGFSVVDRSETQSFGPMTIWLRDE